MSSKEEENSKKRIVDNMTDSQIVTRLLKLEKMPLPIEAKETTIQFLKNELALRNGWKTR